MTARTQSQRTDPSRRERGASVLNWLILGWCLSRDWSALSALWNTPGWRGVLFTVFFAGWVAAATLMMLLRLWPERER